MTRPVQKRKAQAVLAAVEQRFAAYVDEHNGPVLVSPGEYGASHAVVWEGGPWYWPIAFTSGGWTDEERSIFAEAAAEFGVSIGSGDGPQPFKIEGLFLEPLTGYSLGIYREEQ